MSAPGTSHIQPVRGRASERARSPKAEPRCDYCAEPARADNFNAAAGLTICPLCIEDLLIQGAHHE